MADMHQALSTTGLPPRETDLSDIPADAWELAKKRYAILDGLLHMTHRTRADVRRAAEQLNGGMTWTYELLARLRIDARLTSLIPQQRGRRTGTAKFGPIREELVRVAIDELYLTRQQPRVSALVLEIRQRCIARSLLPPSRGAVQRRIDQRSSAEVVRLRRGKKAARDRFAPVTGRLDAERPLA